MILLRRATAARRFRLARSLSQTVVVLARRALRRSGIDEEELGLTFVADQYGQDLADRVRAYLAARRGG